MQFAPIPGPTLTRLGDALIAGGSFLVALLVLYAVLRLAFVVGTKRVLAVFDVDPNLQLPIVKLLHATVVIVSVFLAAISSGVASYLRATEALAAAATLAIGFGAKDVLGNLVSGTFIVLDPEFNIGDEVRWNGTEGVVEDISFRVTRVHTYDNELISVPNSQLTANAVTNLAAKDRRRIRTRFGIGYGDDIDRAREIIVDEATRHPDVLDRPRTSVRVADLGDSAVALEARFWIGNPARADVVRIQSEYVQAVKERFDREGIEMPYPYRQLTGEVGTRSLSGDPTRPVPEE